MAALTTKIDITARLRSVSTRSDGKFRFTIEDRSGTGRLYFFLLTKEKALKLANAKAEFPLGANLRLSGRISKNGSAGVRAGSGGCNLKFVRVRAVDGHDVQAWAERNGSPEVGAFVLSEAQKKIGEVQEEALMRRRAPPDPPPAFKSPKEAYEKAMYLLRRQAKLKDPKLSKTEIWVIRDALNMLKEHAGL